MLAANADNRLVVAGLREHRSQHSVTIDDPNDLDRWRRE
jgi:hypothetical protein